MTERTYEIQKVVPEDKESIISFFKRFFYRDEPLNIDIGIADLYINGGTLPDLEDFSTQSIDEGYSLKAVSNTGEIVGVSINGTVTRDDPEDGGCDHELFSKIVDLLSTLDNQVDIFNKFPKLNKLLDCKILSVDTTWRGMGIATKLLEKTREIAKLTNHQLMRVDCSSYFSALAVAKLGFEQIHELKYSEHYKKGTNEPVFTPEKPHTSCQAYIYKLDPSL